MRGERGPPSARPGVRPKPSGGPSQGWAAVTQPPPHRTHPSPGFPRRLGPGKRAESGLGGPGGVGAAAGATARRRERAAAGRRALGWGPRAARPCPLTEPFRPVTRDPNPGRAAPGGARVAARGGGQAWGRAPGGESGPVAPAAARAAPWRRGMRVAGARGRRSGSRGRRGAGRRAAAAGGGEGRCHTPLFSLAAAGGGGRLQKGLSCGACEPGRLGRGAAEFSHLHKTKRLWSTSVTWAEATSHGRNQSR